MSVGGLESVSSLRHHMSRSAASSPAPAPAPAPDRDSDRLRRSGSWYQAAVMERGGEVARQRGSVK